jgi:oxygen-independent coproporphyrinogen-3 oxidase
MDPEVLRFLGRLNTPASNHRALELACSLVDNVSFDLILATPPERSGGREASIALLDQYPLSHLSAYLLEVHAGTRFGRDVAAGRWETRADEEQAEIYLQLVAGLAERGFEHYEVSNFARPGRESRHNQAYWSGRSYCGLGASAHSYRFPQRWWNLADAQAWCLRIEAGEPGIEQREELEDSAIRDEELLLGLRTREGLEPAWRQGREALWSQWEAAGLVDPHSERPRLTPRGWLVMDQIVERLSRDS